MFRRRLAAVIALVALLFPLCVHADSPALTSNFAFNGPGIGPDLKLNGRNACSINVTSIGNGTIVPETSTDNGATFPTENGISSGSITTTGTAQGILLATSPTDFRIAVTGLTSGVVSGTISCGVGLSAHR